jgi:RNA polymerase sigma-70 factor (ECF subfamily)
VEADASSQPIAILLKSERESQLYRLLKVIDVDYRQALYLQYFEEMKPEQISRIIKKNIKQTYNLLARGKESLRAAYEKMGISWDM